MKLKRIVGLVIAIAMISTLAITASASHGITFNASDNSLTIANIGVGPNDTRIGIVIAGEGNNLPAGDFHVFLPYGTGFADIASVRFSFTPSMVTNDEGVEEPVEIGRPEFIEWGVVARNNAGDFEQSDVPVAGGTMPFVYGGRENMSFTVTNWAPNYPVAATMQLLDSNGAVIAITATDPGTGATDTTTAAPADGTPAGTPAGNDKAPATGVAGIAFVSGAAILSAAAVAISRKRK